MTCSDLFPGVVHISFNLFVTHAHKDSACPKTTYYCTYIVQITGGKSQDLITLIYGETITTINLSLTHCNQIKHVVFKRRRISPPNCFDQFSLNTVLQRGSTYSQKNRIKGKKLFQKMFRFVVYILINNGQMVKSKFQLITLILINFMLQT